MKLRAAILGLGFLWAGVAHADPSTDAATPLQKAGARWATITNYVCTMQSFNRKNDESSTKVVRYTWARGPRVRMEVAEGPDRGSTLTRNASGVMRGCKGGFLSMIAVTLKDGDPRVVNLRGRKFYEADWGSVLDEAQSRMNSGWTETMGPQESIKGVPCAVVDLTAPSGTQGITRDRLWISLDGSLVLRRQQFEGATLVNDVSWWDAQLNTVLDEAQFTL